MAAAFLPLVIKIDTMKKYALLALLSLTLLYAHAQEDYKNIHKEAIVTDSHNDIITRIMELGPGYKFESDLSGITHSDLNRFKEGGMDVQVFSIWCDGTQTHPFQYANRQIDTLYEWVRRNPDKMMIVTNNYELDRALKSHKLGAMIGVEGGHMIENDLSKLDSLYRRGARYLTLTWNNNNAWATSAEYESGNQKRNGKIDTTSQVKGLSGFGKEVVKHMNKLGMMVDLSHPGEQTFWDALHTSTKPVLVSHSNTYALNPVYRNLTDDQIKAVGENGGVIDLNFYSGFLESGSQKEIEELEPLMEKELATLLQKGVSYKEANEKVHQRYADRIKAITPAFHILFDHMEHIIDLIGVDHVGLGADYDGFGLTTPEHLDDVSKYPLITQELVRRGYSKEAIFKILGGNFLRVFRANLLQ